MRLRFLMALALGLTFCWPHAPQAQALAPLKALVAKAKAKPDGLHAKLQAKKHEMKVNKARKKAQRESGGCCN